MSQGRQPIIEMNGVSLSYKERQVLNSASLTVNEGEFVYLIGKNGAGKSSLLKMLYADLKPDQGQIRVGDFQLDKMTTNDVPYLRRKLGIVFQDFQLLPDRNVADNIAFVMQATGWRDKQAMQNRLTELLMLVGLSAKMNHAPHQLSGGEQQRTVIARAMVNEPLILLADEPTGNLDPEVTEHIMEILHKINRQGTAVLMVTHEHGLIKRYPARTLQCAEGKVLSV